MKAWHERADPTQVMSTPKRVRSSDDAADPLEGYAEAADALREAVASAWPMGAEQPKWDKGRGPQPLSVDDLAIGLWAVRCIGVSRNGLSYARLATCFRYCAGVGCHSNKAAAILRTLQEWKLIARIGNYSVGRRGNQYKAVAEGEPMPEPPQRIESPTVEPPPDDMADPW